MDALVKNLLYLTPECYQKYIQSKQFNIFNTNHANLMGEEQDIKSKWIVIKGKSLAQFQMEDSVGLRG